MIIINALLDKLAKRACVSAIPQIFDELTRKYGVRLK